VGVVERAGWDADRDSSRTATLPRPDTGDGAARGGDGGGGGRYRVLLLDAPAHTEARVVTGICRVVPGADEAHAKNCFTTSKQLGLALVTSCLKEHAEFYRQQLYRYGLKTAIEPDTTTA
jgi:ATP-dependent Clp protease adaptor protein ClpS